LSRWSSRERLAPASKNTFEKAFRVSGGCVKAEDDGHEMYNWAVSEPAVFPVFITVNLTATVMSFFFVAGSDTSISEYSKVV
jgi:hypothetical protein